LGLQNVFGSVTFLNLFNPDIGMGQYFAYSSQTKVGHAAGEQLKHCQRGNNVDSANLKQQAGYSHDD
jgi:hypothetical protein